MSLKEFNEFHLNYLLNELSKEKNDLSSLETST